MTGRDTLLRALHDDLWSPRPRYALTPTVDVGAAADALHGLYGHWDRPRMDEWCVWDALNDADE